MEDAIREFIKNRTENNELFDVVSRIAFHVWRKFEPSPIELDDFRQEIWVMLLRIKKTDIENGFSYLYSAATSRMHRIKENAIARKTIWFEDPFRVATKKPLGKTPRKWEHSKRSNMPELAARNGLKTVTVQKRLNRGWTIERALNEPLIENKANPLSLRQRAIAAGLSYSTVHARVQNGWTIDDALSGLDGRTKKGHRYKFNEKENNE